jgi:hypothetical protein
VRLCTSAAADPGLLSAKGIGIAAVEYASAMKSPPAPKRRKNPPFLKGDLGDFRFLLLSITKSSIKYLYRVPICEKILFMEEGI